MVHRQRQPFRLAALVALLVLVAAACGWPNLRPESDAIGERIRTMPGVSAVDVSYDTSFDGGAHFWVTTSLEPGVTTVDAQAVVATFLDGVHDDDDFDRFDVQLELTLGVSTLWFGFGTAAAGPDITADAAHAKVALWLDVVRSPAVTAASNSKYTAPLRVILCTPVDDRAVADLLAAHPELDDAAWVFGDYTSTVGFPDGRVRVLWMQIVEQTGPRSTADATTERDDTLGGTVTRIRIETPTGYGVPNSQANVATAVAALLPRFGHPVQFVVLGNGPRIELVVGGCYRHDPGHVPSPVETQLSRTYERC